MASSYSYIVAEDDAPEYAYALAVLSGGAALLIFQSGERRTALVLYALVAAILACLWPKRAMLWAIWLCLPVIMLLCFDLLVLGRFQVIMRQGLVFGMSFLASCLGAYGGSKLSLRGLHRGRTRRRRRQQRQRISHNLNFNWSTPAQVKPAFKELGAYNPGVVRNGSGHDLNRSRSIATIARTVTDAPVDAQLIKAAQGGEMEAIKRLCAEGADINVRSNYRWTPLVCAAPGGHALMADALSCGDGATAQAGSSSGWTALMIATVEGHTEVARMLIELGADVSARDNRGWSALRLAVAMDEAEILGLLLCAGAKVNEADYRGQTALMQAVAENSCESVQALLAAGADPLMKDHAGRTPLSIAHRLGHAKIISLLQAPIPEAATSLGSTAGTSLEDTSYFAFLKEELEKALHAYPHWQAFK